ncbi:unnamed protein product [Paramecium octaurelia]|uniref:Uncharacterized protein n=1 Tax=Paramecium octaurelia TaxID=43137 RepID=A0A8S1TEP9_PAROT|nr:unnamed protein product [Paramecium octaurelia]
MIFDTIIARANDGLLLCEVQSSEKVQLSLELKRQIKLVLKRGSLSTDVQFRQLDSQQSNVNAVYKTSMGVCYVVFYDSSFNLKLACCYLDEIEKGFQDELQIRYGTSNVNYRSKLETIESNDSYCFQQFERFIKKKKQEFQDQSSTKNMERLKTEITELKKIMNENVKLLFDRDEKLQDMNEKAKSLKEDSKLFKDKAAELEWSIWFKKNSVWFIFGGFLLVFIIFKIY